MQRFNELLMKVVIPAAWICHAHVSVRTRQCIAESNNTNQLGRLVQWLYPLHWFTHGACRMWFDIGSKETLEEANQTFAKL
jgi:hypothetical protein